MCSMLTGRADGHMSSALCVTAGEQESQDGRQPAAFHQEFLKNTRERGRSEERLTPVAPAGPFSPAPWQVVRGHHRDFHTHTRLRLQLVAMRSPLLRFCCAGDPS